MSGVALIYIRKSVVRCEQDRASPERQLDHCMRVCDEKGWTYEVYQDAEGDRSGRSEKDRPEWRRLKTQLGRPEVVAVVVRSLDRASRSPKDFFSFLDLLQKHDVELVSVKERFDTMTAIGKAFLAMLMVVASLESDLASERVSDSVRHRRAKGVHVGIAPFGYRREDGHLVPTEDARLVTLLVELYATGSYSFSQLAVELNRRGGRFRDRYGAKPFTNVSVRSVLQNAWLYAGRLPVGRERDRAYSEIYDGDHEPLISDELAGRVIDVRRNRTKGTSRSPSRLYLLTGLLYCQDCGARLWGRRRGRGGDPTYRHPGPACQPYRGSFPAERLEAEAVALLDGLALPTQLQEMIRERVKQRIEAEPRDTEILAMLKAERARLMRLKEMRLEGEVDREEYLKRKAEITAHIEHLESQLRPGSYEPDSALQRVTDLGRLVAEATPSQRRAGLRSVFERLEVSVESGEIVKVVPQPWFRVFFGDLVEEWE
ncbi:MAG TPA: recombinase family protein [Anaerolineae bacterium]|nr:recombinase family protein [Anaerolineae bacterium]